MHCPICKISWDDGGTPNFTENENLYDKYRVQIFILRCVSMLISKFKHVLFCLSTNIILNFMNNDVIHKTGLFY